MLYVIQVTHYYLLPYYMYIIYNIIWIDRWTDR